MALCFLDTLKTQPLWVLVLCILGSLSIFKSSLRFLNWVYLNFLRLAKNLKKYESSALASSSSSSVQVQQKFQVFLSFRGKDTRNNFTSHLHEALKKKGIDTYVDYRLERGEKIETLFTVIQESKISIIILSENYASSSWCLDELCKILECKKTMGHKVVPIFYHVDPSDVRHIRGSFKKALEKQFWLKLRIYLGFKDRTDKGERWRAALVEVADLTGFHLPGHPNDRLESEVIEEIAQDISEKLMCNSFDDTKPLVGINSRVKEIESLLRFDLKDVCIVGIWGMGGIGKSTIAEVVCKRFVAKFDGYCIVNVRKELNYQQKLFSTILGDENLNVDTSSLDASIIDRLQRKKVFFVLDDVNDSEQLDLLSLKFGSGSRIIVTSRDKQLFETIRVCVKHVRYETYEVRGLISDEALELFSLYAFGEKRPKNDFVELSKEVARCCDGVPLALRVFGSSLCGKTLELCKSELKKLKEICEPKIDDILRIGYDRLDEGVKDIFLDIACFFNWGNYNYVLDLLNGCYGFAFSGINNLIDKSLLTISNEKVKMHDLLQLMALKIIKQESSKPGERSRLWIPEDICYVLRNNTGTESVKGMLLDMSKIRRRVLISPIAFARMYNLKFLKFYYSDSERKTKLLLENDLVSLPDSLSCLQWDEYPSKSLSSNFCAESLVELRMRSSDVERLWDGVQNLVKLKCLDLAGSQYLIKLPDLSNATNLKEILLKGCKKLENFQCSVGWRSLENLSLSGCSNITKFPDIPENLEWLDLSWTAIEEVPSSIERVSRLQRLIMSYCRRLERLPSSICKLKSLSYLSFNGCLKLGSFPEISETMESLKILDLSHTSIEELHSSIKNLVHLAYLELNDCEKLKNLPSSIRELKSLKELCLKNYSNVTKISEIPLNLRYLSLEGTSIEQLPSSINKLLQLRTLNLRYCERLQSLPPELPPNLEYLYANDCKSLEEVSIAFSISGHKGQTFIFTNCLKLDRNCINWVKSSLSIQQKATKDVNSLSQKKVKLHEDDDEDYDEEPNPKSSVSIYFPGSEIPEWFWCKSQGSSVTIQLPPHLHVHNKLVGFAVCAVLAFPDDFNHRVNLYRGFCVSYRYNFKTNQRGFNEDVFNKPMRGLLNLREASTNIRGILGDHVFLGYDLDIYHCWYKEESKHHLTEASFKFSISNSYEEDLSDYCVVKECGVSLWYAQDDFPHRPSEESNPFMIQPSSSYDPTWPSLKCGLINQDCIEPMVEDGTIINHESGSFDLNVQPSTPYDPNQLSLKCGVINQDSVDPLVEEREPQHKRLKYS